MHEFNCPNCGSPIDIEKNKCEYCGTSYFNLSYIDMEHPQPMYLRIKYGDNYIVQKVIPIDGNVEFKSDTVDCISLDGAVLKSFVRNRWIETTMKFTTVYDVVEPEKDPVACNIYVDKEQ